MFQVKLQIFLKMAFQHHKIFKMEFKVHEDIFQVINNNTIQDKIRVLIITIFILQMNLYLPYYLQL